VNIETGHTNNQAMSIMTIFDKYISLSEKWLTKFVLLWCAFALVIGLLIEEDKALAIAVPIMVIIMFFAGSWMLRAIISFQRVNPFSAVKSGTNILNFAAIFFWSFGIIGFVQFLTIGLFTNNDLEGTNFFLIAASVLPLGASLGAAKEWSKNKVVE
jgi:hypothetical protein